MKKEDVDAAVVASPVLLVVGVLGTASAAGLLRNLRGSRRATGPSLVIAGVAALAALAWAALAPQDFPAIFLTYGPLGVVLLELFVLGLAAVA